MILKIAVRVFLLAFFVAGLTAIVVREEPRNRSNAAPTTGGDTITASARPLRAPYVYEVSFTAPVGSEYCVGWAYSAELEGLDKVDMPGKAFCGRTTTKLTLTQLQVPFCAAYYFYAQVLVGTEVVQRSVLVEVECEGMEV